MVNIGFINKTPMELKISEKNRLEDSDRDKFIEIDDKNANSFDKKTFINIAK